MARANRPALSGRAALELADMDTELAALEARRDKTRQVMHDMLVMSGSDRGLRVQSLEHVRGCSHAARAL